MLVNLGLGRDTPGSSNNGKVCRILRSLYGFKQSARTWFQGLDVMLKKQGFKPCNHEQCIYVHINGMMILVYVDNILVAAKTAKRADLFMRKLSRAFKMDDRGDLLDTIWLGFRV